MGEARVVGSAADGDDWIPGDESDHGSESSGGREGAHWGCGDELCGCDWGRTQSGGRAGRGWQLPGDVAWSFHPASGWGFTFSHPAADGASGVTAKRK